MDQRQYDPGMGQHHYHEPGMNHETGMSQEYQRQEQYHPSMDEYYAKTPETVVREHRPSALDKLRDRFPFLYLKKGIAIVVGVLLLIIGGGLAGLAALPRGESSDAERAIVDDSFFYGLSPPTYPSRERSPPEARA
jgi:hypothetical protein